MRPRRDLLRAQAWPVEWRGSSADGAARHVMRPWRNLAPFTPTGRGSRPQARTRSTRSTRTARCVLLAAALLTQRSVSGAAQTAGRAAPREGSGGPCPCLAGGRRAPCHFVLGRRGATGPSDPSRHGHAQGSSTGRMRNANGAPHCSMRCWYANKALTAHARHRRAGRSSTHGASRVSDDSAPAALGDIKPQEACPSR
jgi:hypothetical protein